MAGDWIKIEHVTPDKPEVMRIAEQLGISENEALGGLIRFWAWCDLQSRDGHAIGVTRSSLERLTGVPGIYDAMLKTCWLFEDDDGVHVPHYDYHLSKNAKKRALAQKRKQKHRSKNVTEESRDERDDRVTREEKRREDSKKEKVKRKKASDPEIYSDEFELFWEACPRKVGKGNAWKAWKPASLSAASSKNKSPTETVAEFLTRRMRDYAAFMADKDAQFIRHPATWLNGGNWDDEVGSRVATAETKKNWTP